MKAYYQNKKMGYTLPQPIYCKMIKTVEAYPYYKEVSEKGAVRESGIFFSPREYVQAIDRALESYVPEEYREAVFRHVVHREGYLFLEQAYGISTSTMKRWTQRFLFGVATELGENYSPLPS